MVGAVFECLDDGLVFGDVGHWRIGPVLFFSFFLGFYTVEFEFRGERELKYR